MDPLGKGVVIMMYPNSCRFLSQKGVFILFAIMAFILASFVPLVLAEEQTDTPEAGVPGKKAEGAEHPVSAPGGFMAPTLEGPWRSRIALNAWLPTAIKITVETESDSGSTTEDIGWLINHIDYIIPISGEVRKGSFGAYANLLAFKLTGTLDAGPARFRLGRSRISPGRRPQLRTRPLGTRHGSTRTLADR